MCIRDRIEGAIRHRGASLVDVVSPCVAFNNHLGSTRSYDYVRAHNEAANRIEFVPRRDEITGACDPGSFIEIVQHDGSVLRLRKLEADFDPRDRLMAIQRVLEHQARGELLTGLLYVDPEAGDLHDRLGTTETPLNALGEAALCPGSAALERVNASLR